MKKNYSDLFRQGLCAAAEAWFDVIVDSRNDTPARDEGPTFFIPQGFPHIDWTPGEAQGAFGSSIAEGYALSLAYFVNEYCFHDHRPNGNSGSRLIGEQISSHIDDEQLLDAINDTVDSFYVDDNADWSQGEAVIDDERGEDGHCAAVVYLGHPMCAPEHLPQYHIPLATLFSSLNDSMTVWYGMDPDEYRRKVILWMIMLTRSCHVAWDTFLEDFPAMAPVVYWILTLSALLNNQKDHFQIMDSEEVCAISLATQRHFEMIWGYTTTRSEAKLRAKIYDQGAVAFHVSADAEPYRAMRDYVPGRDV